MAKEQPQTADATAETVTAKAQQVAAAETAAPAPTLSLDEFCRRLSVNDKRVELIGGFFITEQSAGRVTDTKDAFEKRYTDFINKPA